MLGKKPGNVWKSPRIHYSILIPSGLLEPSRELKKFRHQFHPPTPDSTVLLWGVTGTGVGGERGVRKTPQVVLMNAQGWELLPSENACCWVRSIKFIPTSPSKYGLLISYLCDNLQHLLIFEMGYYPQSLPKAIYKLEKAVKVFSGTYHSLSLQHTWRMKKMRRIILRDKTQAAQTVHTR